MRVPSEELSRAVTRWNELQALEGQPFFKHLVGHMTEQVEDANAELYRIPRWNFYRILKVLLRRDAALQLLDFLDRTKRQGQMALEQLSQRDPQAARELKRPTFVGSRAN